MADLQGGTMFFAGMMREIRQRFLSAALASIFTPILCATLTTAQVDTGTILGTVRDATGAVVVGAKVTLINGSTSRSLSSETRGDGSYIFTPLQIGNYQVQAEYAGLRCRPARSMNQSRLRARRLFYRPRMAQWGK
jgi:hypothetical protein